MVLLIKYGSMSSYPYLFRLLTFGADPTCGLEVRWVCCRPQLPAMRQYMYLPAQISFGSLRYPDRSAVEIQYATVYTEGILSSIQCTCSIYWQFSIQYMTILHIYFNIVAVYPQYILQTSWSVHSVYTATILPYTVSLLHFGQGIYSWKAHWPQKPRDYRPI